MSEVCIRGHHTAYCPTWPWDCEDWAWIQGAIESHDGQDGDR